MGMEFAKITNVFALKATSAKTVRYMSAQITARSMGIATAKQASAHAIKASMGLTVARKNARMDALIKESVIMTRVCVSVMRIMKEMIALRKSVLVNVLGMEYARMVSASALKDLLGMIVLQKNVLLIALIMEFVLMDAVSVSLVLLVKYVD